MGIGRNRWELVGIGGNWWESVGIRRNWKEFLGIPELQELIPSRCNSGIPYRNRSFILEVSL